MQLCNLVIKCHKMQEKPSPNIYSQFILFYYNWVKFYPHMANHICRCLQLKKLKRNKKKNKMMQLCNLDTKCHMPNFMLGDTLISFILGIFSVNELPFHFLKFPEYLGTML